MPILNDDLAIDDCRAVKLGCCLRYAWIALGPIEALAGIGTCFATSMIRRGATSIMLDFVDPPCTRSRLIG